MIIKSFETSKINTSKNNIILMYGRNDGLKRQLTDKLNSNFDNIEIYEEKEILDNSNNFLKNIFNKSLFSEKQIFLIKRASDKIHKIIEEIHLKEISDTIIILSALNGNFVNLGCIIICTVPRSSSAIISEILG